MHAKLVSRPPRQLVFHLYPKRLVLTLTPIQFLTTWRNSGNTAWFFSNRPMKVSVILVQRLPILDSRSLHFLSRCSQSVYVLTSWTGTRSGTPDGTTTSDRTVLFFPLISSFASFPAPLSSLGWLPLFFRSLFAFRRPLLAPFSTDSQFRWPPTVVSYSSPPHSSCQPSLPSFFFC